MRYQVVGKIHRVFGKSHGEFFERNLPEAQERHLIGGGFIVRAPIVTGEVNATTGAFRFSGFATPAVEESESDATTDDASSQAQEAPDDDNPEGMSSSV